MHRSPASNYTQAALRSPQVFEARKRDWRFGHVLYQVFVDRFAPSRRLEAKRQHYAAPRRLKAWHEEPEKGTFLPEAMNMSGELEFWGGDLDSLREKLDYLQALGTDVVYLNPIFSAYTNHKYDANTFMEVDPQYGTMEELRLLAEELHGRGMRLMLDGVFNHMGRRAPVFQKAKADPSSAERDWFYFGDQYKNGYRGWRNSANLPEVNLENADLRAHLIEGPRSAVQFYMRDIGVDGWRLDCGPDIGFPWLRVLTDNAHAARADSVVIGECWNYPEEWLSVMDGVMNMHLRALILELVERKIPAAAFALAVARMVDDCGVEGLLRSHNVLDNHDVPRIGTLITNREEQYLARVLQFALPGCPVIYYGSELGQRGGVDPTNRGPMRWELVNEANEEYQLVRSLVAMRRENPALRIGDIRVLESNETFAFVRTTDKARETLLVVVNPSDREVRDLIPIRDSRLMDASDTVCLLTGTRHRLHCGLIAITMAPRSAHILRSDDQGQWQDRGYSMFKRVP